MVQGRLEISARKNPLEVYRKSARVPPADSARKNPLEVSRKSARVSTYTTCNAIISLIYQIGCLCPYVKVFSCDMTSDKPLHVLKEINFARFSLQQSLSEYFPFKT